MPNRATSAKVARSSAAGALAEEVGGWSGGNGPLFRQLALAIGRGIERGALPAGSRLPAERPLAEVLSVSRGTAVAAYDLLVGDGLVERRPGSGTFVVGPGDLALPAGREGTALVHRLVDRSHDPGLPVVDLSISVVSDPSGLPDLTVTASDLAAVVPGTGYSPWGLPDLRSALAAHVTGWGLPTSPDEVVVTTGAQQAIAAAAACWVRPGDTVVVDDPTYPGAIAAFAAAGARLLAVPVDAHGVRPDAFEDALSSRPALAYVQSTLHSPTGSVLAAQRRQRLAEIVVRHRVPMVEDMALADLAWVTSPPPIAAFATGAPIAVVGSLSKLFWGGLRVGWVRAPEAVALRFARVKATHDLGSSALSQIVAARLVRALPTSGLADQRRRQHRERYEVLAAALRRSLPAWTWPEPAGGLSVWVRLPRGSDAGALARAAQRRGVVVATSEGLSADPRSHGDRLRLSFSAPGQVLEEGVARLASAWRE
jgi:DNA-binding transcriptional MocR family regulator